jgi:hypothetical protein
MWNVSVRHQMTWRRTLGTTVGALALTATVALVPLSSAAGRPTVVHTYTTFQHAKLAPGLVVRASVRGSCWTLSEVESRPYTWRCLYTDYIHDPCFSATRTSGFVVCPDAPWSNRVLLLRLTAPLPPWHAYKRSVSETAWPWGIVTIGGKRCVTTAAAATGEVAGKRVTFVCAGGGLLLGITHRATPMWTIWYAPTFTSKHLTLVTIADAWLQ